MTDDAAFAPGQVWTYRGARFEASRVIVGAVDDAPDGASIVSVSVVGAALPDPETGVLQAKMIQHCPISADVLAGSVLARDGTTEPPEGFRDGYRTWRQAYDAGEGGYFTLAVDEIVQMFQTALAPQRSAN